jgi:hypothetical protein
MKPMDDACCEPPFLQGLHLTHQHCRIAIHAWVQRWIIARILRKWKALPSISCPRSKVTPIAERGELRRMCSHDTAQPKQDREGRNAYTHSLHHLA